MAYDGRTVSTRVSGGKFKLVPTAKRVTLQLTNATGGYAGPVVVGQKGRNVILGVRAGAKLGKLKLKKGFAVAKPPKSAIDKSRVAARKGAGPVGAGRIGYVKRPRAGKVGIGTDADRDGVPDSLDIDDDGDLILDHAELPGKTARASYLFFGGSPNWYLNVGLETSFLTGDPAAAGYALNLNARNTASPDSVFRAYMDKALDMRGILVFPQELVGVECKMTWCTPFGKASDITGSKRFPADFPAGSQSWGQAPPVASLSPDRDPLAVALTPPKDISAIRPHAPAAELGAGQVITLHYPPDSTSYTWLANLPGFVATVPALSAWSEGSATLTPVSYPVARDGPGAQSNPIPITKGPDGHYRVRLSIWPPQAALPDGTYKTLGRMYYHVSARTVEQAKRAFHCGGGVLSDIAPSTVELTPSNDLFFDYGFDRPVDRADTITFTLDISQCLESAGLPAWGYGRPSLEIFVAGAPWGGDVTEGVGFAFKPADPPPTQPDTTPPGAGGPPPPPASGTWRFTDGTKQEVAFTVHANVSGIKHFKIQFHEATPITAHSDPSGWTCTLKSTSNSQDTLDCLTGAFDGAAAGSDQTGSVSLTTAGTDGMPVTLTVTQNGTDTTSDMTQAQ